MRQTRFYLAIATFAAIGFFSRLEAQKDEKVYQEFGLEIGAEYSFFFKQGLYAGQERHFPSLSFQPEYYLESSDGRHALTFTGFVRLDRDKQRTHWDIRELYWLTYKKNWELSAGVKKIYWGKTESVHLVDIINQTDQVESFDGEAKLGQPMVHFSLSNKAGIFDVFAMTFFRERTFPGEKGRLRTPVPITSELIPYQSSAGKWHPDFAIRWSNSLGPFDLGLSHFWGTGREPVVIVDAEQGTFDFTYGIIHQTGLDVQWTVGPWLWKLESIGRFNEYQNVFAFAGGFEYTFGNIKESGVDVGVLGEYLYDSRGKEAIGNMDNDIFVGSRIALNDISSTEILIGGIFDLTSRTKFFSVEASRRFGESWKGTLEARVFSQVSEEEFAYFIKDDSFVKASIIKFF